MIFHNDSNRSQVIEEFFQAYQEKLCSVLQQYSWCNVAVLARALSIVSKENKQVFLCGNGGSAGNAIHLANDFLFGVRTGLGKGLRVEALAANPAVLTCLANDIGYEEIFSYQVQEKSNPGDILLVLSGSGNSPNVIRALEVGNELDLKTFAILGYSGGRCKNLAHHPIHFEIDDMQIAEDLQLIVGHMCMQWLCDSNNQEQESGVERYSK